MSKFQMPISDEFEVYQEPCAEFMHIGPFVHHLVQDIVLNGSFMGFPALLVVS